MTEHPITPPPELVQQWLTEGHHQDYCSATEHAIAQAARRPQPPSLKEQALAALAAADGADHPVVATVLTADQHAIIRRALEALPDE